MASTRKRLRPLAREVESRLADAAETRASKSLSQVSSVQRRVPLSNQYLRLGGRISPAVVSGIMRQADVGYIWQLMDLGDELKQKDAHLGTVCFRRETAPTQLEWQLVPSSDRPKALRIAAFTTEALKRYGEIEVDGEDVF